MPDNIELMTPLGMVRWLLHSASIDQLTKRSVLLAALLYATGVTVKNLDLLFFGVHNLNPARASTIVVGSLALLVNIAGTLFVLLIGWILTRASVFSERTALAAIVALIGATLLIALGLKIVFDMAYYTTAWAYDPGNWPEFLGFGAAVSIPLYVEQNLRLDKSVMKGLQVLVVLFCFGTFVWIYQDCIYQLFPKWIGGGRPLTVRLILKKDAIPQYKRAGLTFLDEAGMTPSVQIVDSDDDTITLFGGKWIQLAKARSESYPYSYSIRRDEIESIVYRPRSWSWNLFADDRCWGDPESKSASGQMGSLTVEGLTPIEEREVRSKWSLGPTSKYDNCYPSLFLDQLSTNRPDANLPDLRSYGKFWSSSIDPTLHGINPITQQVNPDIPLFNVNLSFSHQ